MSESITTKMMGWSSNKQVGVYVHVGTREVEQAFREVHGLQEAPKNEKRDVLRECQDSTCKMVNPIDARYCIKCGRALSVEVVFEDESKKQAAINEAFELFGKIMADPKLRQQFEEFKKKQT